MESKEISTLRNIYTLLDTLSTQAYEHLEDFKGDCINWGDFQCISVERRETIELYSANGEPDRIIRYTALFSEAAPSGAPKFKNWIENELLTRYGYDVDVSFEW